MNLYYFCVRSYCYKISVEEQWEDHRWDGPIAGLPLTETSNLKKKEKTVEQTEGLSKKV